MNKTIKVIIFNMNMSISNIKNQTKFKIPLFSIALITMFSCTSSIISGCSYSDSGDISCPPGYYHCIMDEYTGVCCSDYDNYCCG